MPYNLTVSTDDVESKAQAIANEVTDLEARINTLTSAMGELASTWTGSAASAFQGVYENWKTTAQQTQQTLDELGVSLRNAGAKYDDVESSVRSQWT